jgi:hypothetical protein
MAAIGARDALFPRIPLKGALSGVGPTGVRQS